MSKSFDDALQAAYHAGYTAAYWADDPFAPEDEEVTFDQWRATLGDIPTPGDHA